MSDARIEKARAVLTRAGIAFAAVEPRQWRLCYVEDAFAWFTTQPLSKQWGDDWNDAPYEHNAGIPYGWRTGSTGDPYELLSVGFHVSAETPAGYSVSVEQINGGERPWLKPYRGDGLMAGASLEDFIAFCHANRGQVFLPMASP